MEQKDLEILMASLAGQNPSIEIAKNIGEPKDPRKPIPDIIMKFANISTAQPGDDIYTFSPVVPTDYVHLVSAAGEITQQSVSPLTPSIMSFVDAISPEKYISFPEYLKRKENAFARVKRDINTALNSWEVAKVIGLMSAAATSASNLFTPDSGSTRFRYSNLVDMVEATMDYGSKPVLICGSSVWKDIFMADWLENKYQSVEEAFNRLGIEVIRIGLGASARTYSLNDADVSGGYVVTEILPANVAYLVNTSDVDGEKPMEFVRKDVSSISAFGGIAVEAGDKPQRALMISGQPKQVGSTNYLAFGVIGMEELAMAWTNKYCVAKFTK